MSGETREFSWETVVEMLDDANPVDTVNWRHGHRAFFVFESDGAFWRVAIDVHHDDGWQRVDPIRAERVVAVQKTVTVWVKPVDRTDCIDRECQRYSEDSLGLCATCTRKLESP